MQGGRKIGGGGKMGKLGDSGTAKLGGGAKFRAKVTEI
jgi:hypothetical protein